MGPADTQGENMATKSKFDLYQHITDQIVEALETGTAPWQLPWNKQVMVPHNHDSQKAYRGINTLLLWIQALHFGYTSSAWLTFKQAKKHDGHIPKGTKSSMVTFWKIFEEKDDKGEVINERPVLRYYRVFNLDQIEGIEPPTEQDLALKDTDLEAAFAKLGATIHTSSDQAGFSNTSDAIFMPPFEQFTSPRHYWATLTHELIHWTGHKDRLDRDLSGRFGDEKYAMEELVAELGAAFICAQLGLGYDPQHASYVDNWLKVLKDDKYAVFTASKHATQAANYILEAIQA